MIRTEDNHRGIDTSIDAAAMAALTSSEGRRLVMETLIAHPGNLTVDQICAIAKRPRYSLQPRVTELKKLGLVRDTGERRLNASGATAIVWRAVLRDEKVVAA